MVNFPQNTHKKLLTNYTGYRECTIDKLLQALKMILFNTYIHFDGNIF